MHINYWQSTKQNPLGTIGLVLMGVMVTAAFLSPFLPLPDPYSQSTAVFVPPSEDHWLGTNDVGQDLFAQLLLGLRVSLAVAVGVGGLATLLSAVIGAVAGYWGGWLDQVTMRFVDALLAVPPLLLMILAGAYLQPGLVTLILLLSAVSWSGGARIIRGQTMVLKEQWHVKAARCFGAGSRYLLGKHIFPDLAPLLVALFLQNARRAVVMEAGLSFLGITDPLLLSWGKMLHHAMKYIYLDAWRWWLLPVGISLSLTVLAFALLGYALEEAMDPRLGRDNDAQNY